MAAARTPTSTTLPRVVHVHDATAFGGMEIYLLGLLERLADRGHDTWLFVPGFTDGGRASPPELLAAARERGVRLLRPDDPGTGRILPPARETWRTRAILRRADAEIVHIHTCRPTGGRKATLAGWSSGIAVVRTEHCSPTLFGGPDPVDAVTRLFDRMTAALVTVSEHNRREQVEVCGRRPEKVLTSWTGIDTAAIDPRHDVREAKLALGLDPDRALVGAVGRLAAVKGHRDLIDAMVPVVAARDDVDLVVVGDGELRDDLDRRILALGLGHRVRLAGFRSDPATFLRAMDVTVLPSRSEGLPLGLLEYMAYGKASVVSDHPTIVEAAGDTAVVVPVGDPTALAAAILDLLHDPVRAERLGRAARRRVETSFEIDRHVDQVVALYDRVVRARRRAVRGGIPLVAAGAAPGGRLHDPGDRR